MRAWWATALMMLGVVVGGMVIGFGTFSVVEEYDPFCATCHRPQEVTYVNRAQAVRAGEEAVDLASAHTAVALNCVACHRGSQSLPDRLTALQLGVRNTVAFIAGRSFGADPRALTLAEVSCLTCHAEVVERPGFENHLHNLLPEFMELPQVQANPANAIRCVDCHVSHEEAPGVPGFVIEEVVLARCEKCHAVWGRGPRGLER